MIQTTSTQSAISRRTLRLVVQLSQALPALLLAVATLAATAYFFTFFRPLADSLDVVLPIDPADADPVAAALAAIGFAAMTIGLVRGKSTAWWLAMVTLVASLLAQAQALSHPLAVVLSGGMAAVLLADRRRYMVQTGGASWGRISLGLAAVGAVVIGLETALVIATTGAWPEPLSAASGITAAIGNALGLSDNAGNQILHQTSRDAIFGLLLLASRLPFVLAALGLLRRVPEPPAAPSTRARARAIAERYGVGALLPFQLGEDKFVFSPPTSGGLVVYGLAGRAAVVLGDPIGPPETTDGVFANFLAYCHRLDRVPIVYQASAAGRATLLGAGFRLFKVGEEAIIELPAFDLAGPRRANLRHTITRCRRDGVSFRWFAGGLPASESTLCADLAAIDAEWCRRAGPELCFSISHFRKDALTAQPVCVAVSPEGVALAFATFRRTGADGGWVLDLMRRAIGGPPGAVEGCIAAAAAAFRAAGASTLSLGLAPLAGLDAAAGPPEERILAIGARLVRPWYDAGSLAFFKRKFDPNWIPRYGAIRRHRDLAGYMVSLLRIHLAGSFHLPGQRRACEAGQI